MLVTITKVEQNFTKNGAEYQKVTGVTDSGQETTKSIFDNLKDKWPLLQEHATLELKLEKKGQFWNVIGLNKVLQQEPPIEAMEETSAVNPDAPHPPPPLPAPARSYSDGAAIGMVTNRIGAHIDNNTLEIVFGKKIGAELMTWYRGQILGISRIPFDGKDLPKFGKMEPIDPEDIPF